MTSIERLLDPATTERLRWAGRQLDSWYAAHARDFAWRRPGASTYERVVAEVLLQRTRAVAAERVLSELVARYPGWEDLAVASTEDLERVLAPIGLHRRRASALASLARAMVGRAGEWPVDRDELEQLPAVGQYVASAVMLFAHGRAEPLLDGNMARVLERFERPRDKADLRRDPFLQAASRVLVAQPDPVATNWAVLDLGALACLGGRAAPRCGACPLQSRCNLASPR